VAEATLVATADATAPLELEDVRRAMHQLPDEQREALILIAVAGLPYEEVGMICGVAVGTIKSRVSRARQALQALLAEGDLWPRRRPPRRRPPACWPRRAAARAPGGVTAAQDPSCLTSTAVVLRLWCQEA